MTPGPLTADASEIRAQRRLVDNVIAENDELKEAYRLAVQETIDELSGRIPIDVTGRIKAEFGRNIRDRIGTHLYAHVAVWQAENLAERGLPMPPLATIDKMANQAVENVLQNNKISDIFATVQKAVRTEGSPRGKNYSLERLLSDEHVEQVTKSLASVARDDFEDRTYKYGSGLSKNNPNGLTGQKRWITSGSEDSRHSELNNHVFGPKGFSYKGGVIHSPRAHPKDVSEWSGCLCQIEYARNDGTWV